MLTSLFNFLNKHITVTPADFEILMSKLEECNFKKKEHLTEIGEMENYLHFVSKGIIRRYFYKEDEEIITHIVKEGGVIGSSASFFSGLPSRYVIEAMEPTTTFRISKSNLESLFCSDNKKWEKVGRIIISHFLVEQETHILDSVRLSVQQRFVKFVSENSDLLLRVPQKYLASYLNIKQETFSRMKHLMLEKKIKVTIDS